MPCKTLLLRARNEALKSDLQFRVGAVLYKGTTILQAKYNQLKYIGYRAKQFSFTPTRHAEIAVMHRIPRHALKGCSILVVRVDRESNQLTCAYPCIACLTAMYEAGISKVYYSDYDGEIKKLSLTKPFTDYRNKS